MTYSWDDFPVTAARPPKATYWRLDDNSWFAIMLWAAGPEHVVATVERKQRKPIVVTYERADGTVEEREEPFTAADQTTIDDDIDETLAHVGLPARPRGLDWYLRVDKDLRKDLMKSINRRVEGSIPADIDGEDYLPAARAAMEIVVPEELAADL